MYGIGWRRIMTRGNNDGLNGNEFGDDGTTARWLWWWLLMMCDAAGSKYGGVVWQTGRIVRKAG